MRQYDHLFNLYSAVSTQVLSIVLCIDVGRSELIRPFQGFSPQLLHLHISPSHLPSPALSFSLFSFHLSLLVTVHSSSALHSTFLHFYCCCAAVLLYYCSAICLRPSYPAVLLSLESPVSDRVFQSLLHRFGSSSYASGARLKNPVSPSSPSSQCTDLL